MIMIIQCRFIICNQGSTLVGNVDSREMSIRAGGGGGGGGSWEFSVLSIQFYCEPKTAPKVYYLKKISYSKYEASLLCQWEIMAELSI